VHSLDGKKQGAKHISALALSPDGSLLAWINQDGLLELYRLPAAVGAIGLKPAQLTRPRPSAIAVPAER